MFKKLYSVKNTSTNDYNNQNPAEKKSNTVNKKQTGKESFRKTGSQQNNNENQIAQKKELDESKFDNTDLSNSLYNTNDQTKNIDTSSLDQNKSKVKKSNSNKTNISKKQAETEKSIQNNSKINITQSDVDLSKECKPNDSNKRIDGKNSQRKPKTDESNQNNSKSKIKEINDTKDASTKEIKPTDSNKVFDKTNSNALERQLETHTSNPNNSKLNMKEMNDTKDSLRAENKPTTSNKVIDANNSQRKSETHLSLSLSDQNNAKSNIKEINDTKVAYTKEIKPTDSNKVLDENNSNALEIQLETHISDPNNSKTNITVKNETKDTLKKEWITNDSNKIVKVNNPHVNISDASERQTQTNLKIQNNSKNKSTKINVALTKGNIISNDSNKSDINNSKNEINLNNLKSVSESKVSNQSFKENASNENNLKRPTNDLESSDIDEEILKSKKPKENPIQNVTKQSRHSMSNNEDIKIYEISDPSTNISRGGPRGLRNTELTCYMNSMLQALASSLCLIDELQIISEEVTSEKLNAFLKILKSINKSEIEDQSTFNVSDELENFMKNIGWNRISQQDAFQVLSFVINKIEKDIIPKKIIPPKFKMIHTFSETPKSNRIQVQLALAIPLCDITEKMELHWMLDEFFKPSSIDDGDYTMSMSLFSEAPTVLILHIQANQWEPELSAFVKPKYYVNYKEILEYKFNIKKTFDESKVLPEDDTNVKYKLVAVVKHTGDISNGHYITYRRHGGLWYLTSDEQVEETSFNYDIVPYIMVYERIS